jgi:hypothetical protein
MSFFSELEADFKKLFGHAPTYIHLAISAISFGAPVVEMILSAVDPAAVAVVQPIVTRIEAGLATAYTLTKKGTSAGATLASTLTSVQSDLTTIESTAGIKSPETQAKIATLLAEIQAVVALIDSEITTGTPPTTTTAPTA